MAIKIQTQQTYIPIYLGDLELRFDVTDENIKKFKKEVLKVQEELEKASVEKDSENAMDQAKEALKQGFEVFFGVDVFEKVYEISPSIPIVMQYFERITEAISEEFKKMGYSETAQQKAQKYLQNR